jgi:hypothetical protein
MQSCCFTSEPKVLGVFAVHIQASIAYHLFHIQLSSILKGNTLSFAQQLNDNVTIAFFENFVDWNENYFSVFSFFEMLYRILIFG